MDKDYQVVKSYRELRQNVTQFLYKIREDIEEISADADEDIIGRMVLMVRRVGPLSIETDLDFEYRHGQLEWRWLCLTIYFKYDLFKSDKRSDDENHFGRLFRYTIFDLLTVAMCRFNQTVIMNIGTFRPYPCSCYSELWLLIQLLVERNNELRFWTFFNESLSVYVKNATNVYTDDDFVLARMSNSPVTCQNYHVFVPWIMYEVAELQAFNEAGLYVGDSNHRISENYEFLEKHVCEFLSSDPDEESLRIFMCLILKFFKIWSPKPEIVIKFWEYFHKKINSPFFIGGSLLSAMSVTVNTGHAFLEKIKKNVATTETATPNKTSFTMFLDMIAYLIKVYRSLGQTNQINRLMGRVYLKLIPLKLSGLNETGINNVGQLLLTLAITTDIRETGTRMCDILLNIALDRLTENLLAVITKLLMAAMLILVENSINIENYVTKFLAQLGSLVKNDRDETKLSLTVMKIVVQDFEHIFAGSLELGEHRLFDAWIESYMNGIYPSELDRFFGITVGLLQRIEKTQSPNLMLLKSNIYAYVLPFIKQNANTIARLSNYTELATVLCLSLSDESCSGLPRFRDTFQFFIQVDHSARIDQFVRFWLNVIESDKIVSNHLVLKNWMKCCIFSHERNPNLDTFTRYALELPEFQAIYKNQDIDRLLNSKYTHHAFFEGVGLHFQTLNDVEERTTLTELTYYLLEDFDKWAKGYYSKSHDNTVRVYKTIGKIILYCAPICYIRTKANCFFSEVITNYILPCPILMGKMPEPNIAQAVHLIWPLLVEGFSKLDYKNDPQIKKYLMDLVLKWTPHFRLVVSFFFFLLFQ